MLAVQRTKVCVTIFTRVARGLQPRNGELWIVNMFGRRTVRKDMMTRTVPNVPWEIERDLIQC